MAKADRMAALALLLALPSCIDAPPPAVSPAGNAAETELRGSLARLVAERQIPGAIAIVEQHGRRLADVAVGYQDVERQVPLRHDAIFRLYSMSKPITSVAAMILVERGQLRLSDPVVKFLPEFRDMRVYVSGDLEHMRTEPISRPITVEDLLTHRSGITYHFTGYTPVHQYYRKYGVMRDTPVGRLPTDGPPAHLLDELVARVGKAPLLHHPGTEFAYSYSTTVLGAVIERASGQRLNRFLEDNILAPLGMRDTGFFISDEQLPRFTTLYTASAEGLTPTEQPATSDYRDRSRLLDGGGAIAGTADDYLRFAKMLAEGGTLDGHRILSEASIDAMFTPHAEIAGLGAENSQFGYGFALGDEKSGKSGMQPAGTASWSGSGNTYFFVDRRHKAAAVLMTHMLASGEFTERTLALRRTLNAAAERLIEQ